MNVIAYDPFVTDDALFEADGVKRAASVGELYEAADFLSLHIPATAQTRGSIGYELLMSMPKGATLVNTARKEVIDEAGVVRAMTEREDLKYITDIAPDAQAEMAGKFGKRFSPRPRRWVPRRPRPISTPDWLRRGRSSISSRRATPVSRSTGKFDSRRGGTRSAGRLSPRLLILYAMVRIKPFRGIRPPKEHAAEVASRPYDVLNSAEAKAEASERSLLHIIKPEIDFDPIADEHAEEVYDRAVENFRLWRERGWLQQDEEEHYYVYAQTMDGRTQYGLAMCCHFEDYRNGAIKKHELTRPDKEEDRMKHVRCQRANIEPVFFAYPDNAEIDALVEGVVKGAAPDYDFTAEDGFGHRLWVIRDRKVNDRITEIFKDIPALYVADGHHRTAAAARVGEECMLRNPNHRGDEEYCFFLAVTFPASQLRIIDYNRVVRDLNGMTPAGVRRGAADGFRGGEDRRRGVPPCPSA